MVHDESSKHDICMLQRYLPFKYLLNKFLHYDYGLNIRRSCSDEVLTVLDAICGSSNKRGTRGVSLSYDTTINDKEIQ
jgi:hypothetical protein